MPTVPIDQNQYSLNVPGVQAPFTREFGKLGTAIEGAGNQIENTASTLEEQKLTSDAINNSANAFASDQMWLAQRKTQLLLNSPDGMMHDPDGSVTTDPTTKNPVTIADQLHSDLNDRYQANQDNMNNITKQMYRKSALPHFSNEIAQFETTAQQQQVEYQNTVMKQGAEASAGLAENTPSVYKDATTNGTGSTVSAQNFYDVVRPRMLQIQQGVGSTYNQTTANSQSLAIQEKMSGIAADNMLTNLFTAPHPQDPSKYAMGTAYKQLLQGEDPESVRLKAAGLPIFSDMMDPLEKDAKIRAIDNAMPALKAADNKNAEFLINARIQQAERGELDTPGYLSTQKMIVDQIKQNPNESNKGVSTAMGLATAQFLGKQSTGALAMMTEANRNDLFESIKPQIYAEGQRIANEAGVPIDPALSAVGKTKVDNAIIKYSNTIKDGIQTDAAKFFMQPSSDNGNKAYLATGDKLYNVDASRVLTLGSPEFQKAWSDNEKTYESAMAGPVADNPSNYRMGIPKTGKFSTQAIGTALTDTNKAALSEDQKGIAMQELQKGFGKDFPNLIDQMIKDKNSNVNGAWRLWEGRDLSDRDSNTFLMSALLGNSQDDRDEEKKLKDQGILKPQIMKEVEGVTKNDVLAKALSNPLSNYDENTMDHLQSAVYSGTLKYMAMGFSAKDAAQKSHDMILGPTQGSTLQVGGRGSPSPSNSSSVITLPQMIDGKPVGEATKDVIHQNVQGILDNITKIPIWNPSQNRPMTDEEKQGSMPALRIVDAQDKSKVQATYLDSRGIEKALSTTDHYGKEHPLTWDKNVLATPQTGQPAPERPSALKSFEQYLLQKFSPTPQPSPQISPDNGPIPSAPKQTLEMGPILHIQTKAGEKADIAAPTKQFDEHGMPMDRNFVNSPDYNSGRPKTSLNSAIKSNKPPADILNDGMHNVDGRSPQGGVQEINDGIPPGKILGDDFETHNSLFHFTSEVVSKNTDSVVHRVDPDKAAELYYALKNGKDLPKWMDKDQLKMVKQWKDATGTK